MEKSTAELTKEYIRDHPHVKSCLKKGIINYSSLSRVIASELKIEKKTSVEAILIAARREQEKLKEDSKEDNIKELLKNSEQEIKNKMGVFILGKEIDFERVQELQSEAKKSGRTFLLLEGSNSYTLIAQEAYSDELEGFNVKKETKGLAMINFRTNESVEDTPGVMSYLTSLFGENGVNIVELFSCWTDNIFIIESKDIGKAMEFLNF